MFVHTDIPEITELKSRITNSQRWYTTPEGIKYPSVTTVLGAKPKPYLEAWRTSLGPKKADKETKRCADRGTAVHKMAEDYLNNVENPAKGHESLNVKMFNQLKLRINNINNIRLQEAPLYSDMLKIAGRVDVIGEYKGVLSVIDFKTSNSNKDDKMIEDYKLQCTMYSLCWYEMFGEFIENFAILIAVEKGMVPLCFQGNVHDYIPEAQQRINMFYSKQKGKS
jgi:genome maintenance exonuclease 1